MDHNSNFSTPKNWAYISIYLFVFRASGLNNMQNLKMSSNFIDASAIFFPIRPYASGQGSSKIRAKRGVSNNKSLTACSIGDEPISRWEEIPYWHHEGQISWFIFEDLTKFTPFQVFFTFEYLGMAWTFVRKRQTWVEIVVC